MTKWLTLTESRIPKNYKIMEPIFSHVHLQNQLISYNICNKIISPLKCLYTSYGYERENGYYFYTELFYKT